MVYLACEVPRYRAKESNGPEELGGEPAGWPEPEPGQTQLSLPPHRGPDWIELWCTVNSITWWAGQSVGVCYIARQAEPGEASARSRLHGGLGRALACAPLQGS